MFPATAYAIAYNLAFEGAESFWDYPGFELWKFVNLAIFVGAGIYLHRVFGRPISEALRSRKERIRSELKRAREERDHALQQLAEVESRLQGLDAEIAAIRERSAAEAEAEEARIRTATEFELSRLRESAQKEIESAGKAAATELRRFASEQSIQLAEEFIRREIGPEDEARLMRLRADSLGGTRN
jgi:F-type H+-transporting ATPase subunit b